MLCMFNSINMRLIWRKFSEKCLEGNQINFPFWRILMVTLWWCKFASLLSINSVDNMCVRHELKIKFVFEKNTDTWKIVMWMNIVRWDWKFHQLNIYYVDGNFGNWFVAGISCSISLYYCSLLFSVCFNYLVWNHLFVKVKLNS